METTRVMTKTRALGYVATLAIGMAFVMATPMLAETDLSRSSSVCGPDRPESHEPWAVPPQQGRPGEPY